MIVLNKKGFKLPHVEKDKFVMLLRLGLQYDRASGLYRIGNTNNLDRLLDLLREMFGSKDVCFTQTCLICGKDFPCQECRFYELCDTRNLPLSCVCGKCLEEGKVLP
jgi:hypothetical protein